MADKSAIEWTEATLNPWTGCTKVSPGCANCYIVRTPPLRVAGRAFVRGHVPLVFHMERLERVVRRRRPTLYFVNSLSDLFHEDASDGQVARVFAAMAAAPQHTFQVLTKRPERMRDLVSSGAFRYEALRRVVDYQRGPCASGSWPLRNVWLGTSIENRRFVGRADVLRATPAAVRFVSAEPLLGPLVCDAAFRDADGSRAPGWRGPNLGEFDGPGLDLAGVDWLIVGGESGPGHRPIRTEWVRDLRDACLAAGTAFFLKQWGGRTPKAGGRLLDGRTWDEMPERVAA